MDEEQKEEEGHIHKPEVHSHEEDSGVQQFWSSGIEQLSKVLKYAIDKRPEADCFLARGSGMAVVNGEYRRNKLREDALRSRFERRGGVPPFLLYEHRTTAPAAASTVTTAATVSDTSSTSNASNATSVHTSAGNGAQQEQQQVVLSLFRAQVRSGAYYWYISQHDDESPGTAKDVDYYLQEHCPVEDKHVPCQGWRRRTSGKKNRHARTHTHS